MGQEQINKFLDETPPSDIRHEGGGQLPDGFAVKAQTPPLAGLVNFFPLVYPRLIAVG